MISGGSYLNCGQSVDSMSDSLFDHNLGYGYHTSDSTYLNSREASGLTKSGPFLAAFTACTGIRENGGRGPMISGWPYQNRVQSIDSLDASLLNPNRG